MWALVMTEIQSSGSPGDQVFLVDVDTADLGLRWKLRVGPSLLVARSTRNGVITDVQRLGPAHGQPDLPPDILELISMHITQEIARVKLAALLSEPRRDRWAA